MSAETLRRAAALMRERTQGASPAPWAVNIEHGRDYTDEAWSNTDVTAADGKSAAWYCDEQEGVENAEHIASWHPDVALAVAAWMEAEAEIEEQTRLAVTFDGTPMFGVSHPALAVARAYLGEQA